MAPKPKTRDRKLKVYRAEIDGLNDWVVAAPSRPEALKAFGVNQDLFAQGEAGETSDPDAIKAARAAPGAPLRRPKGSSEPFAPATGSTDWSAAIPKAAPARAAGGPKARPARPSPKPKPDRRPLDRAEARLAEIEAHHRDALKRLAEDQARLDDRREREAADHAETLAQARRAVDDAKRTFRDAGGD